MKTHTQKDESHLDIKSEFDFLSDRIDRWKSKYYKMQMLYDNQLKREHKKNAEIAKLKTQLKYERNRSWELAKTLESKQ